MTSHPTEQPCPGDDTLTTLLTDQLERDRRSEVSAHVDNCPRCLERLEALTSDQELRSLIADASCTPWDGDAWGLPQQIDIPGYAIETTIGIGEQGIVYRANHLQTQTLAAIKIMRSTSRTHQWRFRHESDTLRRLSHPGITRYLESGTAQTSHGERPFIAVEFVEGRMITDHCRRRKVSVAQRVLLLIKICDALHHAHQQGVVHRDLKPDNILVDVEDQPKILDFGVARNLAADMRSSSMRTVQGQLIGTLPYMSPEQVRGEVGTLDRRSDVYAAGVLLYVLVANRLPYGLSGVSVPEATRIICEVNPPLLTDVNRYLSRNLALIADKALQKNPEDRHRTARELAADLRRHLAQMPAGRLVMQHRSSRRPSTFARMSRSSIPVSTATLLIILAILLGFMLGRQFPF